jgi:hypothetical protein
MHPPNRAHLRAGDCGGPYCRRVADKRNALDKHLGLSEQDSRFSSYRREALINHVGEALDSENYAAAQVYAMLLIAEKLGTGKLDVRVTNTDELGNDIANCLTDDLRSIASNIGAIG